MMLASGMRLIVLLILTALTACGQKPAGSQDEASLTATDLERVREGVAAPDFTLQSYTGETVTLSELRGKMNVVLVFYRGHW